MTSAHTKESAKSLADTIQLTHSDAAFALVVAMANDKDHIGFAKQLLSGGQSKAVILTEIGNPGDQARTTPASLLKDVWIQAALESGIEFIDIGRGGDEKNLVEQSECSLKEMKHTTLIGTSASVRDSMKIADQILKEENVVSSLPQDLCILFRRL